VDVDDYDEARLDEILPDDEGENKALVGIAPRKPEVAVRACGNPGCVSGRSCIAEPCPPSLLAPPALAARRPPRSPQAPQRFCPYLDSINRHVLDFDFEKVCSISNSHLNVYACLVCGKYFQVRLCVVYMYVCIHTYVRAYVHTCRYACMCVCVCAYVCMYICMYVCMYVCMCVCV